MTVLVKIAYDGTNYHGFQIQDGLPTVFGVFQDALLKILGHSTEIKGCSRTDSGVHAYEYYATVEVSCQGANISSDKVPRALASVLPDDISVISAWHVEDNFSVRRAVSGKEYVYTLWTKEYSNPFLADRAWHYTRQLNISKMNEAAKLLQGKQDFAAFMSSGSSITDTVRTITRCEVIASEDGIVKIYVAADGFLYNMVRIIVGTLVYVSEGKIKIEDISDILRSKDRKKAGKTAPAGGLYLNKVFIEFER